jgi:hypothetical protein
MMGEIRPVNPKRGQNSLKMAENRHFSRNLEPCAEKTSSG